MIRVYPIARAATVLGSPESGNTNSNHVNAKNRPPATHTPRSGPSASSTPIPIHSDTRRHGFMNRYRFPNTAEAKGTTSQNPTQTRTDAGLRAELLTPTMPAAITMTRVSTPIPPAMLVRVRNPGTVNGRSSGSSCRRGSGHRAASAPNDRMRTTTPPVRKYVSGTGRSVRPPIPCAPAGRTPTTVNIAMATAPAAARLRERHTPDGRRLRRRRPPLPCPVSTSVSMGPATAGGADEGMSRAIRDLLAGNATR